MQFSLKNNNNILIGCVYKPHPTVTMLSFLSEFCLSIVHNSQPTNFVNTSSILIDHLITRKSYPNKFIECNQVFGVFSHDLVYLSYKLGQFIL